MFIGKSVCIGAVLVMYLICALCFADKNMNWKNKIILLVLVSCIAAIVWTL